MQANDMLHLLNAIYFKLLYFEGVEFELIWEKRSWRANHMVWIMCKRYRMLFFFFLLVGILVQAHTSNLLILGGGLFVVLYHDYYSHACTHNVAHVHAACVCSKYSKMHLCVSMRYYDLVVIHNTGTLAYMLPSGVLKQDLI